jgi:sodium/proline symporter
MALGLTFGAVGALLVAIGVYFFWTTDTRRLTDYMLAGRDVGTWPIALSEVASVASGWTFFAWVGVGFTTGLHGLWFSMTMLAVVLFAYRYVAPTFRVESEALDSQTVVDHLAAAYAESRAGPWIRLVATGAVVVFMVSYIGAQIIAVGEAMDTALGLPYATAVVAGGLAVAAYTVLGGFNASVWTDVVQGVLVIGAAVALPIAAINAIGGWSAFVAEANAADPTLLALDGGLSGGALATSILAWVAFGLGAAGQPHGLMRFQAIRSTRLLSAASVIAMAFQALRLTVPLFIGIAGRVLYAEIGDPEAVAMQAMTDLFPGWMAGLLLAGIIGAILSTSDSMMIVTSADLTRLYTTWVDPDASTSTVIALGRGVVAGAAACGIGLALWQPGTIFAIIEFAFVGLGVTLGLPLAAHVLWDGTTAAGILATVVVGLVGAVANLYLAPDLFPILVWPAGLAALVAVSWTTGSPDRAPAASEPAPADASASS